MITLKFVCLIGMFNKGAELINACLNHKTEIFIIALLIFILNLAVSQVIFGYISELFETEDKEPLCEEIGQCLLNTLNYGLSSGGRIQDYITSVPKDHPMYETVNRISIIYISLTVLLTFILLGVVGLGCYAHIKKVLKKEKEIENRCLVCRRTRNEIENSEEKFREHIEKKHNCIDYIFFLIRAKNKGHNQREKYEESIVKQIENGQTDWLPRRINIPRETEE